MVLDGLKKVSDGLKKVLDGLGKVSHGLGNASADFLKVNFFAQPKNLSHSFA